MTVIWRCLDCGATLTAGVRQEPPPRVAQLEDECAGLRSLVALLVPAGARVVQAYRLKDRSELREAVTALEKALAKPRKDDPPAAAE